MKKTLITITIILVGLVLNAQEPSEVKSEVKDSITALDVQKHIYLLGNDIYEYGLKCYRDSIDIREFYGKPLDSEFWKNKGRFYWSPMEPLPNVRYLHWLPSYRGFIEYLSQKYTPKK